MGDKLHRRFVSLSSMLICLEQFLLRLFYPHRNFYSHLPIFFLCLVSLSFCSAEPYSINISVHLSTVVRATWSAKFRDFLDTILPMSFIYPYFCLPVFLFKTIILRFICLTLSDFNYIFICLGSCFRCICTGYTTFNHNFLFSTILIGY